MNSLAKAGVALAATAAVGSGVALHFKRERRLPKKANLILPDEIKYSDLLNIHDYIDPATVEV
jgi:hypothetical protein